MDEPLARTAVAHGIELSYTDNGGVRHDASPGQFEHDAVECPVRTGGNEERIESTLPPVRSPKMVPRS